MKRRNLSPWPAALLSPPARNGDHGGIDKGTKHPDKDGEEHRRFASVMSGSTKALLHALMSNV
jgi:hypothetical protein